MLEALPEQPDHALEALAACSFDEPLQSGLAKRLQGMQGAEVELCPKARKLYASPDSMDKVAKKCDIDWPFEKASGPRALVVGHALTQALLADGVADELAVRTGQIVAGIHGRRPRLGSYWAQRDAIPQIGAGPLLPVGQGVLPDGIGALEPGEHLLIARPGRGHGEDIELFGLPFAIEPEGAVPVLVEAVDDGIQVSFGRDGDVVTYPELHAALRAVRFWLDWAQEFGETDMPDRIGVSTPALLTDVLTTALTADGARWFDEVLMVATPELLQWEGPVDAIGIGAVHWNVGG